MHFNDFKEEFIEVLQEGGRQPVIEVAWKAFNRVLVKNNLAVLPNDPLREQFKLEEVSSESGTTKATD